MARLSADPPEKLERVIVALARAWKIQALLGRAHYEKNPARKRELDPLWHAAWTELGLALDDLELWRKLYP